MEERAEFVAESRTVPDEQDQSTTLQIDSRCCARVMRGRSSARRWCDKVICYK